MLLFLSLLVPTLSPEGSPPAQEARDGPFKAVVASVPDLDRFDAEWKVSTEGVLITSTGKLVRNKYTYVVVLLSGCKPNASGKCQIEVVHKVTGPDGKPYDGLDGTKIAPVIDIAVTRTDAFYMAPQLLGVRIEPGEALGPYRFEVTVRDKVGARSVSTSHYLTAVEPD